MTHICYNSQPIGEVTPHGKTLDKAALACLSIIDRIRAYLLMVAPAARSTKLLASISGVTRARIPAYLAYDLKQGVLGRQARGQYYAIIVPPRTEEA